MKNSRRASLALIITLSTWLNLANAVSDEVRQRATTDLGTNCLHLFLNNYQFKNAPLVFTSTLHRVFLLSENGEYQYCRWRSTSRLRDQAAFEQSAISECDENRPVDYTPCEVYAHDDDITYLSVHARLEKAKNLFESGDLMATENVLDDIKQRNLSALSQIEKGEYENLFGKVLINSKDELDRNEAMVHFNNSWYLYRNVNGAVEEGNLRIANGNFDKNWASIRAAYQFFLEHASDKQKSAHPEVEQNLKLTEPYYLADLAQKEAVAKLEAVQKAKQEKLEAIKEAAEKRKQESIRKAEERRVAKEGDGSEDDLTCKKYGAKPGTQIYVDCRIKLGLAKEEAENRKAEAVRSEREQAEYNRQQQAAQQSAAVQRAAEEDNRRSSAALMAIGGALMGGGVRPQSPAQNQNIQVCTYDQFGNRISCYADYQSCLSAARGIGGQCH
jgi:hypothetical protein